MILHTEPPQVNGDNHTPTTCDPVICYIDGKTPCDGCRAAHEQAELARDTEARERARHRDIARSLAAKGIAFDELVAVLLPAMAPGITAMVCAILDERGAA